LTLLEQFAQPHRGRAALQRRVTSQFKFGLQPRWRHWAWRPTSGSIRPRPWRAALPLRGKRERGMAGLCVRIQRLRVRSRTLLSDSGRLGRPGATLRCVGGAYV